jgi:uncharacterized protein YcbK (DUF882 family)
MRAWVVAVVLAAGSAWAEPFERFFIMGDGRLSLVNAHTDARVDVRYRRADGTYDESALRQIRRVFRSKGDDGEGRASLRLIEILSRLQAESGVRPLTLMSGYRDPSYNDGLRAAGKKAAGGSLHMEGLAADVAFPRKTLRPLWMKLRAMDCCGAGYYAKEGFLHIDVGRPRFWEPATSRVEENLSAGNARVFARTEFDRYAKGEAIALSLHAMTVPPIRVARMARWSNGPYTVGIAREDRSVEGDVCMELESPAVGLRVTGVDALGRGHLLLTTCEPRPERTPLEIKTNSVDVR